MWRQRYRAVLGFAMLLALIAVVFTLLLLVNRTCSRSSCASRSRCRPAGCSGSSSA
jgi:hypothetical protein